MSVSNGPGIVTSGLVFHYDIGNTKKSWRGAPITNSQWNSGNEVSPWTVNGVNTDVSATVGLTAPIPEAKTWEFRKTGGSDQWNGWESTYGGIWTGSSGDYWSTSYWYKTLAPAGHTGFGIGSYFTSNWSRSYNVTVIDNVSSIIPDGKWHYNYTVVRFNEDYSNAICVDGPSWGYSSQPGTLYLNGLCWNKNSYAAPYAAGTRSNTQAIVDLTGNNTTNAYNLTYNNDNTFSFQNNYSAGIEIPSNNFTNLSDLTMSCVMKYTGTQDHYTGAFMSSGDWNVNHWAFGINQSGSGIDLRRPYLSYGYTFTQNQWYMVTWTRSGTTNTIFVNGTSIGSQTSSDGIPLVSNSGNTMFGRETYAGGYFNLQGELPVAQIYNRALSASEVKQNFSALRSRYGI